jgi:hypothetical protein
MDSHDAWEFLVTCGLDETKWPEPEQQATVG